MTSKTTILALCLALGEMAYSSFDLTEGTDITVAWTGAGDCRIGKVTIAADEKVTMRPLVWWMSRLNSFNSFKFPSAANLYSTLPVHITTLTLSSWHPVVIVPPANTVQRTSLQFAVKTTDTTLSYMAFTFPEVKGTALKQPGRPLFLQQHLLGSHRRYWHVRPCRCEQRQQRWRQCRVC